MRGVPSTLLPPLPRAQYTLDPLTPPELLAHMALLRELYMPPIHGGFTASDVSVQVRGDKKPRTLSGGSVDLPGLDISGIDLDAVSEESDDEDDANDPFEREWAEKWLNGVVRRAQACLEEGDDSDIEAVLREATAVLAMMAGTSAAGSLTRHLVFPLSAELGGLAQRSYTANLAHSPETTKFLQSLGTSPAARLSTSPSKQLAMARKPVLPVLLHDAPMSDHLSVGVQTWGSAILLGRELALDPDKFGLFTTHSRVLELGAGTGLLSILCRKLLDLKSSTGVVVATDFLPDVLDNLRVCVDLNSVNVEIAKLDWTTFPAWMERRAGINRKRETASGGRTPRLASDPVPKDYTRVLETQSGNPGLARRVLERLETYTQPEEEELAPYLHDGFDLVIASDCVYDPTHAGMLREVASWVLRLPEGEDRGGTFVSVATELKLTPAYPLPDTADVHARTRVHRRDVHPAGRPPIRRRRGRGPRAGKRAAHRRARGKAQRAGAERRGADRRGRVLVVGGGMGIATTTAALRYSYAYSVLSM